MFEPKPFLLHYGPFKKEAQLRLLTSSHKVGWHWALMQKGARYRGLGSSAPGECCLVL